MYRLFTLGQVHLVGPGDREVGSILAQPKRLALLVYLALANSGRFRRRDTLLALFWPDLDRDHARASLRQALSYLRRCLGEGVVLTRGDEEVGVDPARLWCDALAFDAACARSPEEALALYHGSFLPGFYADGAAPELDAWFEEERTRRRREAGRQVRLASERAWAAGDRVSALALARDGVRLVPEDEGAAARLIGLLDRTGDRVGALAEYESLCRMLRDDYGAEPAPETKALVATARGRIVAASTDPVLVPPGDSTVVAVERDGLRTRMSGASRVAVLALVGGLLLWGAIGPRRQEQPAPIDHDLVAVAPFAVIDTDLSLWREGLAELLASRLDGAGPLRAVPMRRVVQVWGGRVERETAVALGRTTRAGIVIFGRLLASGPDTVRVMTTVLDLASGSVVDLEVRDDLDRMDLVGDSLATRVLRELARTRPIAAVRGSGLGSTSLPALKAFLTGEQFYRRNRPDSALDHFGRAVALDGSFALAWRGMMKSLALISPGTDSVVRAYGLRAGMLNRGLAPRDSLLVVADSLYQARTMQVGDPDLAEHVRRLHATLEDATRRYPQDAEAWFLLGRARLNAPPIGHELNQTLAAFDSAIALDSSFLPALTQPPVVQLALRLRGPDAATRHLLAQAGAVAKPAQGDGHRFAALLLTDPDRGYSRLATWADTAAVASVVLAMRSLAQWPDTGEAAVAMARAIVRRARTGDSIGRNAWPFAGWRSPVLYTLAVRGHLAEAYEVDRSLGVRLLSYFGGLPRDSVDEALASHKAFFAGLPWWAARRDTVTLHRQLARFDSLARWASGSPDARNRIRGASVLFARREAWYDGLRTEAYLALARGDTAVAIARFVPLIDSLCVGCSWTRLFTDIYIAGQLLHLRGRDAEAERWLRYDAIAVPYPVYDVAMELVLGRVAESQGKLEDAGAAYGRVLALWRHADRDLDSLVAAARAGLARLEAPRSPWRVTSTARQIPSPRYATHP